MELAVAERRFERGDLAAMTPLELIPHYRDWIDFMEGPVVFPELQKLTRTLLHRGIPAAILGVNLIHLGVGEVWGVFQKHGTIPPFTLVKRIQRLIQRAFDELQLWRLQVAIQPDFAQGIRLVEVVGFKYEAQLQSYLYPGRASLIYSRCRE